MVFKDGGQKPLAITAPTRNWQFRAPQTHLWLKEVQFSASTFVVKIANFLNPQNVGGQFRKTLINKSNR